VVKEIGRAQLDMEIGTRKWTVHMERGRWN